MALIAAVASVLTTIIATFGVVLIRRNRKTAEQLGQSVEAKLETGNGIPIGPTVHRIDQTVEVMAANLHLQSQTLVEHGRALERLWSANKRSNDMLNDQRVEQEEFVAKVSPLCDWVEQKQREEGTV